MKFQNFSEFQEIEGNFSKDIFPLEWTTDSFLVGVDGGYRFLICANNHFSLCSPKFYYSFSGVIFQRFHKLHFFRIYFYGKGKLAKFLKLILLSPSSFMFKVFYFWKFVVFFIIFKGAEFKKNFRVIPFRKFARNGQNSIQDIRQEGDAHSDAWSGCGRKDEWVSSLFLIKK